MLSTDTSPRLESKAIVKDSINHPLIIEWSSADRGALENRMKQGTVAIEFTDGQIMMLSDCSCPGRYEYKGFTRKLETRVFTTEGELDANFSMGAARLGAALHRYGKLYVSLSLVGRFENDLDVQQLQQIRSSCSKATHVVRSASVGAFRFYSGEGQSNDARLTFMATGPDAALSRQSEFLAQDGEFENCEEASGRDRTSPEGCSALVRLELQPLSQPAPGTARRTYNLGTLPFIFSDVIALDAGVDSSDHWSLRGPFPVSLCREIAADKRLPELDPLFEYCIKLQSAFSSVSTGGYILSDGEQFLENQFFEELFGNVLQMYSDIQIRISRFPEARRAVYSRLALHILSVYYWHLNNGKSGEAKNDEERRRAVLELLSPLLPIVENGAQPDDRWWAAHLLTVAGIQNDSAKLVDSDAETLQFAKVWHLLNAPEKTLHDVPAVFYRALESMDDCNPLRADLHSRLGQLMVEKGDAQGGLKQLILYERELEKMGIWETPDASVFQSAQYLGVTGETEEYLNSSPWVRGDFLWAKAEGCFLHEDYLCVRHSLYQLMEETPASPMVPWAYAAIVELEKAMGNRSKAFRLKMEEPSWSVHSDWAKGVQAVPSCPLAHSRFETLISRAVGIQAEAENMSTEKYVLVGRNAESWQALMSVGNALRDCRIQEIQNPDGWVDIVKPADTDGVKVQAAGEMLEMQDCISRTLQAEWRNASFGIGLRVRIESEFPWYMDPATGWSRLTRYRLACDEGEVEGCYQLGLTLMSNPGPKAVEEDRAKSIFAECCQKGHAGACKQLHTSPN